MVNSDLSFVKVFICCHNYTSVENCYISLPHGSLDMGLVSSISGCILIPANKQGHSLTHSSMSQVRKVLIN